MSYYSKKNRFLGHDAMMILMNVSEEHVTYNFRAEQFFKPEDSCIYTEA
jgi:hypothetical protein